MKTFHQAKGFFNRFKSARFFGRYHFIVLTVFLLEKSLIVYTWRLKYWQKYFPRRKAFIVLEIEIAQRCRVEALKLMYGSETISSLGRKIWDILPTELKKLCLLHYSKRKLVNGPQRIVHVVYVKCVYKTLDFCKLTVRTYFVL